MVAGGDALLELESALDGGVEGRSDGKVVAHRVEAVLVGGVTQGDELALRAGPGDLASDDLNVLVG